MAVLLARTEIRVAALGEAVAALGLVMPRKDGARGVATPRTRAAQVVAWPAGVGAAGPDFADARLAEIPER